MLFRGWANALLGDVAGGLGEMRDALASEEEAGTPEDFPLYYEMFAEVCGLRRPLRRGSRRREQGFAQAERGRLVYWNAELHRRRGELLLAAGGDRAAGPRCFEEALAGARAQGARSSSSAPPPASRASAATREGRTTPRRRLRAAYAGFARGLDTPDLREARALLEALR